MRAAAAADDSEALVAIFGTEHRHVVVTADSRKFNTRAPMVACDPHSVTHLVTDLPPDEDLSQALKAWGVEVRIAANLSKK